MSFCGFCGVSLPTGATFCGECGRKTDEPFVDPNVRAASADAMTAAMPVIVPATPDHNLVPAAPAPAPTSAADAITGRVPRIDKQGLPGGVTALLGLLGLVAVGVGLYIITKDDGSPSKALGTTIVGATPGSNDTTTAASTIPADPEQAASDELQAFVAQDRPTADTLVGTWVVQLSAKRVGLEADGIVYGPVEILADHATLRSTYGAILVDGGAFQFQSGGSPMTGWFLTIVPHSYASKDEAVVFCSDNGLGPNLCLARQFKPPNP